MRIRDKVILSAAIAVALAGTAAAAAAVTSEPIPPGYTCKSVYSGGGWIRSCTADPAAPETQAPVTQVGGADRFETSAMLSSISFEPGVDVAYIANGVTLVDALGAAAAAKGNGPVLAVPAEGRLPDTVAAELARLDPKSIVIVGGAGSVSEGMVAQVTDAAAQ